MSREIAPTKAAKPRGGPRHYPALLTLCGAVLIAQLDTSVVNLAVRPIGAHFQTGIAALQWVLDGYNIAYALLLLTGGLLADLYGRRRVFMAGTAIFTLASILCGLAPTIALLIGGRVFAGVGAALLLPASLATIRVVWPDEAERGQALGIWAACNGLSFAIGPTLGGLLIERAGWRSVFFVVVPLGIAVLGLATRTLPESADPEGRAFDAPAQALGAAVLGGLALAAIEGKNSLFLALLALGGAALALPLFWMHEARRGAAALVPLDLFRIRRFRNAVLATAGMTFGMYGVLFLQPLAWQAAGTLSPIGAGIALMPMALVFVAVSPLSGTLQDHLGAPVMTGVGVGVIGCGLWVLAFAAGRASIAPALLGLGLTGLGMGLATGPLFGVAVGAVSASRSGTASALINVARMIGATLGVAILGSLFGVLGGGPAGLRAAMLAGGVVQILGASLVWLSPARVPASP